MVESGGAHSVLGAFEQEEIDTRGSLFLFGMLARAPRKRFLEPSAALPNPLPNPLKNRKIAWLFKWASSIPRSKVELRILEEIKNGQMTRLLTLPGELARGADHFSL
jgi:hypothetical protein